jgi:hypothetical protein
MTDSKTIWFKFAPRNSGISSRSSEIDEKPPKIEENTNKLNPADKKTGKMRDG